jgi:predicted dehydrogenase
MKFLVIGLGSMGKRRIRCLKALGYTDIVGFDIREDRQKETAEKYGVKTVGKLKEVSVSQFDALIVSTPPDKHAQYAKIAIDYNKPAFIEASVILDEVKEIKDYNKKNIFIAPSCTMRFHPMIKDITAIIKSKKYGKVTNFSYHCGQYLPDWHPWEDVKDFYVSNPVTGGGREIVPFELTWIVDTMGFPKDAKGFFEKTIDFGADIEDSYAFALKYDGMVGNIIVDVVSRYATRNLIINLETAQIKWNWDEECFKVYEVEQNLWITYTQPKIITAEGYNKNINEKMYIDELELFIKGVENQSLYPNTIEDDIKVLEILEKIEQSDGGFKK